MVYICTKNTLKRRSIPSIALTESNKDGKYFFMLLYTGKEIHRNDWVELPIEDEVVKRVKEPENFINNPTFDQYPMFEWAPGKPILDNMPCNEDKGSDKEKSEDYILEEILEEVSGEEDMDEDAYEGIIISYESDKNETDRDTKS